MAMALPMETQFPDDLTTVSLFSLFHVMLITLDVNLRAPAWGGFAIGALY